MPEQSVIVGIDFGMDTTKIVIDDKRDRPLLPPELLAWSNAAPFQEGTLQFLAVPSAIGYTVTGNRLIGSEADGGRDGSTVPACRWLKHYLLADSPVHLPAGEGRMVPGRDAAADYLNAVFSAIASCYGPGAGVLFTVPHAAPEGYRNRIAEIAAAAGIIAFRPVEDIAAVAREYAMPLTRDQPVLVIDIGVLTHTVTLAIHDDTGQPVRVIGQAEGDFGGARIDAGIADAVCAAHPQYIPPDERERMQAAILRECRQAKERLSAGDPTEISFADSITGRVFHHRLTRQESERILTASAFADSLNRTIDRTFSAAQQKGYAADTAGAIILAGGCAAIPLVTEIVHKRFLGVPVRCSRPLFAAACGALAFAEKTVARKTIRHDYAIRFWDPAGRSYAYRLIVRAGTPYPGAGQVARLVISGAYDGQTLLGIPVCEFQDSPDQEQNRTLEMVADAGGRLRCADVDRERGTASRPVWVNEQCPAFLEASPPAQKGVPRFELTFFLDNKKQLLVTARDILTGSLVKKEDPIVQLS